MQIDEPFKSIDDGIRICRLSLQHDIKLFKLHHNFWTIQTLFQVYEWLNFGLNMIFDDKFGWKKFKIRFRISQNCNVNDLNGLNPDSDVQDQNRHMNPWGIPSSLLKTIIMKYHLPIGMKPHKSVLLDNRRMILQISE